MSVHIYSVNFDNKNAEDHHTKKFEVVHMNPSVPVVRRGQKFYFSIKIEGFIHGRDQMKLTFGLGPQPNPTRNTMGSFFLKPSTDLLRSGTWNGRILSYFNSEMKVEVTSPPFAPFGSYKLKVECLAGPTIMNEYSYGLPVWILFNPWSPDDVVYMEDPKDLKEYVLCETGKMYLGTYDHVSSREWSYGQFTKSILEAVEFVLERAKIPSARRGDPVSLVRKISKIVNANDDRGVLVGNWSGKYVGGTSPSSWTGSVDILERYMKTGEEVKFGQCWVFSGVTTTICRAIGIPCRPISNLVSAHDVNASLTIDKYRDSSGKLIEENEESVWNYHVWNEAFMKRDDLPEKGYGGWQAIDATPQETSDGVFQCGPAPVRAIRNGEIGLNYDVAFMLSSVNADIVHWKADNTSPLGFKRIVCDTAEVGKKILTKRANEYDYNGDADVEDITSCYKYAESSNEERISFYNAVQKSDKALRFNDDTGLRVVDDVSFKITDLEKVLIGDDIVGKITMQNNSNAIRSIEVALSVESYFYTGKLANVIYKDTKNVTLRGNGSHNIDLRIRADEYIPSLVEYCNMKIEAIANVRETNQVWIGIDDFRMAKPKITIKLPKTVFVNQFVEMQLSFQNPINLTLTNGYFNIACPGLFAGTLTIPVSQTLPRRIVTASKSFSANKRGLFTLIATYTSNELIDVTGSQKIDVLA